ncbi:MAG TPA: sialate O-acetylesterase [Bryobacteraceae bacterium]|nr:sialate O-acetylesterase [Bryobacteraceae bacterium]
MTLLRRLAFLAAAAACSLPAEVSLPALFADHMVIQRDLPVHVWGRAGDGEAVSVEFQGNSRNTQADDLGFWSVYLPPVAAGGPYELTVKGTNAITVHDVLVGDVWIASGQSNMEFALQDANNAQAEIAAANDDGIRAFHVHRAVASHTVLDVTADSWEPATPQTAGRFSAVAYFFARDLRRKSHVPIGILESYWGGTPAEAWTSLASLSADASLMPVFATWARVNEDAVRTKIRRKNQLERWKAEVARAKAEGKPAPGRPWAGNDDDSWSPAGLFNAMIAPLTHFPIRGAIWYQGENNATEEGAPTYPRLFQTMIQDWRKAWGEDDFPFLFVQLANFKTGPNSRWPELRDAQRQALNLRHTGMAVTIDIGDAGDIHPKNKQDVGARLALAARAVVYGENIEYSGPIFRQAIPEGGSLRVRFDHAGGLKSKNAVLRGFEVAGADRKYQPAEARIDGSTVVVSSSSVPAPVLVRYAWADNPEADLYNSADLPASPFRSGE